MDEQSRATLSHRYGDRPARVGRTRVLVLSALLLGGVVWAVWASRGTQRDVSWRVDRFDTQPSQVVIDFTLHRDPALAVTCSFRARGRDGRVVGTGELTLPPSKRRTVSSQYSLVTTATPVTGEIQTCQRATAR